MEENTSKTEPEIDLKEIFLIIWKRKYFIIIVSCIFMMAAWIITVNLKKVYRQSMTLEVGIFDINNRGEKIFVESPSAIKDMIRRGAFNSEISGFMKTNSIALKETPKFDMHIYKNSNIIKLIFDTPDPESGKQVLIFLSQLLEKHLVKIADTQMIEQDVQNDLLNEELNEIESQITLSKNTVMSLQKRIDGLDKQLVENAHNHSKITKDQKSDAQRAQGRDKLFIEVFYSSLRHQNVLFGGIIRGEIDHYAFRLNSEKESLKRLEYRVKTIKEKIKIFTTKKDKLKVLEIISPPNIPKNYIKPNIKKNVILSLFAGLLFSIIGAFFVEYVMKR